MKKTLLLSFFIGLTIVSIAQENPLDVVYRRSSLYTLMVDEPETNYASVIEQTFVGTPIPDKFNDHLLEIRKIPSGLTPEIIGADAKRKVQSENISRFLEENHIARDMVAKWFNRNKKGTFNMNLIADRGTYDASEMDIRLARSSERGMALLADAGEELINNTFVVVNDFSFTSKEEVAGKITKGISILKELAKAAEVEMDTTTANLISAGVTVVGKGYVIVTTSYLYQLEWNDSIAAVFYNDYWMDENSYDVNRKIAFENSDIFKLKYVGYARAWADLQSTIFTTKSEEELVRIATVRAHDAVIAKLQRKFEIFRTKTPLFSVDPLSAKIGLKEGLEKGDKFEVLEQVRDKSGRTKYKQRGVITVDKDHIWDNRFMATEEQMAADNLIPAEDYTIFKGSSKYYPGSLIRQIGNMK